MTTASIKTEMLVWARERAGFSVSELAKKCSVSEDRLLEWETGLRGITFKQAMTYASKVHIPFGYLFLARPPVDELSIPDLRTVDSQGLHSASANLKDLIKLMQFRQEWYRDHLKQQFAEPNPIVGSFSDRRQADAIVKDIRSKLGYVARPSKGSWEDYYRELVGRIEQIGILVMRQADMGHFTRPLSVEEFRGFALVDEYAPLIFINDNDSPGAKLFTLLHEICHIWIGQTGISDGGMSSHHPEETLCNAVAAEFLVPAIEFHKEWNPDREDWRENLPDLESTFHVSTWVLARRALTLGYISQDEYNAYTYQLRQLHKSRAKPASGPDYYVVKRSQISKQFAKAVTNEALSGQLLLRDASNLLGGIKPSKVAHFAEGLK